MPCAPTCYKGWLASRWFNHTLKVNGWRADEVQFNATLTTTHLSPKRFGSNCYFVALFTAGCIWRWTGNSSTNRWLVEQMIQANRLHKTNLMKPCETSHHSKFQNHDSRSPALHVANSSGCGAWAFHCIYASDVIKITLRSLVDRLLLGPENAAENPAYRVDSDGLLPIKSCQYEKFHNSLVIARDK